MVERDKLLEIGEWFADKKLRKEQGDLIVFLSTDILDRILARSSGLVFSVPEQKDFLLRIDGIETDFRDGLPIVVISSTASKSGWPVDIGLKMSALLDVDQIIFYAPDTKVGLKGLKVTPSVKYGHFQFSIHKIVEAILSTNPEIYSELPS